MEGKSNTTDTAMIQSFEDGHHNFCICENGWKGEKNIKIINFVFKNVKKCINILLGENCNQCRPYWNCPNQEDNACNEPNECICYQGSNTNQFCSKKHSLAQQISDPIFFKDQNMVRSNPGSSNSTLIDTSSARLISPEVAKKSPEIATSRATEKNTLPPLKPRI